MCLKFGGNKLGSLSVLTETIDQVCGLWVVVGGLWLVGEGVWVVDCRVRFAVLGLRFRTCCLQLIV